MKCPICGGRAVGKVGIEQYYCWNCFMEYQYQGSILKVYKVSEDGCLVECNSEQIS